VTTPSCANGASTMPLSEMDTALLAREWILVNDTVVRTSSVLSVKYNLHTGFWTIVTKKETYGFKNKDDNVASEWCWAVSSAAVDKPVELTDDE
jgi:hypothetical protein